MMRVSEGAAFSSVCEAKTLAEVAALGSSSTAALLAASPGGVVSALSPDAASPSALSSATSSGGAVENKSVNAPSHLQQTREQPPPFAKQLLAEGIADEESPATTASVARAALLGELQGGKGALSTRALPLVAQERACLVNSASSSRRNQGETESGGVVLDALGVLTAATPSLKKETQHPLPHPLPQEGTPNQQQQNCCKGESLCASGSSALADSMAPPQSAVSLVGGGPSVTAAAAADALLSETAAALGGSPSLLTAADEHSLLLQTQLLHHQQQAVLQQHLLLQHAAQSALAMKTQHSSSQEAPGASSAVKTQTAATAAAGAAAQETGDEASRVSASASASSSDSAPASGNGGGAAAASLAETSPSSTGAAAQTTSSSSAATAAAACLPGVKTQQLLLHLDPVGAAAGAAAAYSPLMLQVASSLEGSVALQTLENNAALAAAAAPFDPFAAISSAEHLSTLRKIRSLSLQSGTTGGGSGSGVNSKQKNGSLGGALGASAEGSESLSSGCCGGAANTPQQQPRTTTSSSGVRGENASAGQGTQAASADSPGADGADATPCPADDGAQGQETQHQRGEEETGGGAAGVSGGSSCSELHQDVQRLMAGLSAEERKRIAAAAHAASDVLPSASDGEEAPDGDGASCEDALDERLRAIGVFLRELQNSAAAVATAAPQPPELFAHRLGSEALLQHALYEWMAAAGASAGASPANPTAATAAFLGVLPDAAAAASASHEHLLHQQLLQRHRAALQQSGQQGEVVGVVRSEFAPAALQGGPSATAVGVGKRPLRAARARRAPVVDAGAALSLGEAPPPRPSTPATKRLRRGTSGSNPESGFPGVSWNSRMQAWLAFFVDAEGTRRSHTFKCNKFGGVESARVEAIDWLIRKRGEIQALTEQAKLAAAQHRSAVSEAGGAA